MTEPTGNAVQAAALAALVALLSSGALLARAEPVNALVLVTSATAAAFVVTLALWWLVFASPTRGKWHGLLLGPLIVALAMLVTMMGLGVATGGKLQYALAGTIVAAIGLAVVGPALIPIGAIAAVLIRWLQLRPATPRSPADGDDLPLRSSLSQPRDRRALTWSLCALLAVVAVCVLGVATLAYLIFVHDVVRFSATSPSGGLTFRTSEGCLGHACHHQAIAVRNLGWFTSHSEPCRLGISADFAIFGPGASASWNADETVVAWTSPHNMTGKVDLRSDCSHVTSTAAPSATKTLFIHESCLFEPCRRRILLAVRRRSGTTALNLYRCRYRLARSDRLFSLPSSGARFDWSADEATLRWRTATPPLSGTLDVGHACTERIPWQPMR